ncbi:MAG: glycosyltransferase [Ignavibacteriales bacterium]|nr:glycosyltransferase [Ignavibacteriales bacterium]
MTTTIVITLLALSLAYYLHFLWKVSRGLTATTGRFNTAIPMVSVVVAARNEEEHIEECILSLGRQSYDRTKYEVVLVDDHSQDRTLAKAKEAAATMGHFKCTLLSCADTPAQQGKPTAIALGISRSEGEIILCTDADCIAPSEWIASTVRCFQPDVAFVAGLVAERPHDSLFSKLQSLEFLGLISTGAGLIGSGDPIICNGANIAYRKSAFQSVHGYGDGRSSCDDETLMQRMMMRNAGKVIFNFDSAAIVTTSTPETIRAFWNQRTRWASKHGHYEDKRILLRLILLYSFFLIVFVSGVTAAMYPILMLPLLVVLAIKGIAEFTILRIGARLLQQPFTVWHFLIAELCHVPYIVFAAFVGQFGTLRWKNRNFGR